jgi:hypothetical protein
MPKEAAEPIPCSVTCELEIMHRCNPFFTKHYFLENVHFWFPATTFIQPWGYSFHVHL